MSARYSATRTALRTGAIMVVFTLVKGGLMYEAAIGGQKFKFTKR